MLIVAFLFSFFSISHASDGQSGSVLPGALPISDGGGSIGLATGQFIWGDGTDPTLAAEVSYGLREKLSIHAAAGRPFQETTVLIDSPHSMESPSSSGLRVYSAVRYMLRDRPGLRVSTYVATFAHTLEQPSIIFAPGFALEGGWKRIRLDFSVVRQAIHYDSDPHSDTFRLAEVPAEGGISVRIGEHHSIRAGGIIPTLSYRYSSPRFYAELGHSQPQSADRMWNAKVGARF